MIAAYLRVSSKAQKLATQRHAIEQVCKARGLVIDKWYTERVSSRNERPELRRLRADIRGGRFERVFLYKLDRLSRGTICEMLNLMNEFAAHGCKVESVADGVPFEGPFAEFTTACIALCAAVERSNIQDRVASARARVEASGGSWGRPGVASEAQREIIATMAGKGIKWRTIARRVKLPLATVYRYGKKALAAKRA